MDEVIDELEGLNYDKMVLNHNVHKVVNKIDKLQNGSVGQVSLDEGAMWLIAGLGYYHQNLPDQIIQGSLDDTIIVSKSALIEFINSTNKDSNGWRNFKEHKPEFFRKIIVRGFSVYSVKKSNFIIESGIGNYQSREGDKDWLYLRLSSGKGIMYPIKNSGCRHKNNPKEDCDFEWSYLD